MDGSDPHDVLGVSANASEEEIKRAYRAKVKQYHPDVSDAEDAETKFKRIHEAYNSLLSEGGGHGRRRSGEDKGQGGGHRRSEARSSGGGASEDRRRSNGRSRREDRFKVMEEYDDGWRLAVCRDGRHTGEWVVYRSGARPGSGRGAGGVRYLSRSGEASDEAVYFGTRRQAEGCYEAHAGSKGDAGERGFDGSSDGRRKDRGGTDGRRRRQRRTDGARRNGTGEVGARKTSRTDEVQGEKVDGFDSLWSLYRSTSGGEEYWAVASELSGSPYYLSRDGEQQRDAVWFGNKPEAEQAYDAYMSGAADRGGPSRNLTGGSSGGERRGSEGRRVKAEAKVRRDTDGSRRPPVSVLGAVAEAVGQKGWRYLSLVYRLVSALYAYLTLPVRLAISATVGSGSEEAEEE
jgi:curved DNA-binding protein CbpA